MNSEQILDKLKVLYENSLLINVWLTRKEIQLPIREAENVYIILNLIIGLLVKDYEPLAHINKVIKLLKFESAMNLQCSFLWVSVLTYLLYLCWTQSQKIWIE